GETGETRWSRELSVAVKAQALVSGGRLVFADVAGGLETLDPKTGTRLWRREAEQPLRTWCWAGPISSGDSIVLGLPSRVVSVHPETGETIWERKRLVPHANLLAHSGPVAAAGLIIIGFWPFSPELFALDAGNGEVRWTVEGPDARQIEG